MGANTIKLEAELLDEVGAIKPRGQSLSSFVKMVLRKEVNRVQMRRAAQEYMDFLASNPEERELIDEWSKSDLDKPIG